MLTMKTNQFATTTGRYLVTFKSPRHAPREWLHRVAGLHMASTADGASCADITATADDVAPWDGALYFDTLGVAVVNVDAPELKALQRAAGGRHVVIEPERVMVPLAYCDTASETWGLQAVAARVGRATGRGVKIAVLDTGLGDHADLAKREHIARMSFVPGEDCDDEHGHGTHCVGTAMGCSSSVGSRLYGVAPSATILAGKVLSNEGYGQTAWILEGIEWAIREHATVISMSLGADVRRGAPFDAAYEQAAKAALDAGTLVVAAAGNSGAAVGAPANCPSVMAVAAVGHDLVRARFSSIGYDRDNSGPAHKGPDIAAPGVDVYSSVPQGTHSSGFASWSGTSMATPHVAGCAALWAEKTGLRGRDLWRVMVDHSRRVGQSPLHVGAGLVQVPA